MADRFYRPEDLVTLPVRDVVGTLALSAQLVTAAAHYEKTTAVPLPAPLSNALDALRAIRAELEVVQPPAASIPAKIRSADSVEDNAVAAFADWLHAFMRLPLGNLAGDAARGIFAECFGDGDLSFLKLKPLKEWAEVEARLKVIVTKDLAPKIAALGGKPILDHLELAHRAYGVAVGATVVLLQEAPPAVRIKTNAVQKAIRVYVVRVSGSIDDLDPETEVRAEALLKPLTEWVSPVREAKHETTTSPAATTTTPTTTSPAAVK
ncbi:MAG: hypothetical protein WCI05_11915 [Myxococcales bacterium]